MYASLIGAGASQLYDLLRSDKSSSTATDPSQPKTTGGTASFGANLNKLLLDLQSNPGSSSASTDPTTTVANDLHSMFSDLRKAGGGHHHHEATDQGATPSSSPFQGLASSLLAYANTQGLTSTQTPSTSLTA